jgi:hypothetical protein
MDFHTREIVRSTLSHKRDSNRIHCTIGLSTSKNIVSRNIKRGRIIFSWFSHDREDTGPCRSVGGLSFSWIFSDRDRETGRWDKEGRGALKLDNDAQRIWDIVRLDIPVPSKELCFESSIAARCAVCVLFWGIVQGVSLRSSVAHELCYTM